MNMRKINIITFVSLMMMVFAIVGCDQKKDGNGGGTPIDGEDLAPTKVEWMEDNHSFGEIKAGEIVEHTFKFKNIGDNPLAISSVKPSCGCTTPEYSKEPVKPGEDGFMKVVFDSKGKSGKTTKSVTVIMNTEPKAKTLKFSGNIIE